MEYYAKRTIAFLDTDESRCRDAAELKAQLKQAFPQVNDTPDSAAHDTPRLPLRDSHFLSLLLSLLKSQSLSLSRVQVLVLHRV